MEIPTLFLHLKRRTVFYMNLPWGSVIAIGTFVGAVMGILTDNVVSFIFLGVMFGIIGEMFNKEKRD